MVDLNVELNFEFALVLTRVLISIAVFFQSLEMLLIRPTFGPRGVWKWEILKSEFGILAPLLRYKPFLFLLIVRAIAAEISIFYFNPFALGIMALVTLLIAIRWRGTFNGGCDSMTLLTLNYLCLAAIASNQLVVQQVCLALIALQSGLSFFLAGVAKIRSNNWRTGRALQHFGCSPAYSPPKLLSRMLENPRIAFLGSWTILLFEILFPLAFLSTRLAVIFLVTAGIFQLGNFIAFGLNRFFFAWIATYPAILFVATVIHRH